MNPRFSPSGRDFEDIDASTLFPQSDVMIPRPQAPHGVSPGMRIVSCRDITEGNMVNLQKASYATRATPEILGGLKCQAKWDTHAEEITQIFWDWQFAHEEEFAMADKHLAGGELVPGLTEEQRTELVQMFGEICGELRDALGAVGALRDS